jgi:DNA-binding response OmpR family regulator
MTRIRILVVDDDPEFATGLQDLLERNHFSAASETDASKVRERCIKENYDIFLIDVHMGTYHGLDVLIDIMSHNLHSKVIMMSGSGRDTEEVLKCFRLGAAEYLTKPTDPGLWLQRILITHKRSSARNIRDGLIEGIWFDLQALDKKKKNLSQLETKIKGRRLEQLFKNIFESIVGFGAVSTNVRSPAQEIDIEFENNKDGMWRDFGGIILAECKCWASHIKAEPKDLDAFSAKLSRHATAKLGFFISWSGFTQGFERVRWASKSQGRCVVAVQRSEIERLIDPTGRESVLRELVRTALR